MRQADNAGDPAELKMERICANTGSRALGFCIARGVCVGGGFGHKALVLVC